MSSGCLKTRSELKSTRTVQIRNLHAEVTLNYYSNFEFLKTSNIREQDVEGSLIPLVLCGLVCSRARQWTCFVWQPGLLRIEWSCILALSML